MAYCDHDRQTAEEGEEHGSRKVSDHKANGRKGPDTAGSWKVDRVQSRGVGLVLGQGCLSRSRTDLEQGIRIPVEVRSDLPGLGGGSHSATASFRGRSFVIPAQAGIQSIRKVGVGFMPARDLQ